MRTTYSRLWGNYVYDIEIHQAPPQAGAVGFRAQIVNMVRLESCQTVPVNPEFLDEDGATPAEAVSQIDAAVKEWVKNQTPSH